MEPSGIFPFAASSKISLHVIRPKTGTETADSGLLINWSSNLHIGHTNTSSSSSSLSLSLSLSSSFGAIVGSVGGSRIGAMNGIGASVVGIGVGTGVGGDVVGDELGSAVVGDALGDPVGETEGASVVGDTEGASEPFAVGDPVGTSEAVTVGDPEGAAVILGVGSSVGGSVGSTGTGAKKIPLSSGAIPSPVTPWILHFHSGGGSFDKAHPVSTIHCLCQLTRWFQSGRCGFPQYPDVPLTTANRRSLVSPSSTPSSKNSSLKIGPPESPKQVEVTKSSPISTPVVQNQWGLTMVRDSLSPTPYKMPRSGSSATAQVSKGT